MDKIIIEGGHRLKGEVAISGAKNAAILALEILSLTDKRIEEALARYRKELIASVRKKDASLEP